VLAVTVKVKWKRSKVISLFYGSVAMIQDDDDGLGNNITYIIALKYLNGGCFLNEL